VKAILHARTPEVVALSGSVTLRGAVNGGNFIGSGLPVVTERSGQAVAAALDRKGAVLLSGNGIVLAASSIYKLVDRAFQVRQNALVQQRALALRGKVTYLVDLQQSAPARREPPASAAPAQQPGPPEGRG